MLVGFSLGANLAVKYLGEVQDHPFMAAVSACNGHELVPLTKELKNKSSAWGEGDAGGGPRGRVLGGRWGSGTCGGQRMYTAAVHPPLMPLMPSLPPRGCLSSQPLYF